MIVRYLRQSRRNELLAELFQRSHRIEKWGRGIKMILEREPQTEFEELGTHFIATFKRKNVELPAEALLATTTQKTSVKTSVKLSRKLSRKLPRKLPRKFLN